MVVNKRLTKQHMPKQQNQKITPVGMMGDSPLVLPNHSGIASHPEAIANFSAVGHTHTHAETTGQTATDHHDNSNDHASGSDNQVASDFNHNDLANIPANDHIDWTISQAPTVIHADNYTDTNTTYVSSDFDHNQLTNTHNLTTDIDHNSITNNRIFTL